MSTDSTNINKLAFSSRCLPGSAAEQEEKERMEAFQREKAERLAQEALDRPQVVAQRHQEYLAASEGNKERMKKKRVFTYKSESTASEVLRRNV
jgi:hypothetical protein